MRLRFLSNQLTIESGEVLLARQLVEAVHTGHSVTFRVQSNETEDLSIDIAGEIQVSLANCVVRLHRSTETYEIPLIQVAVLIRDADLTSGVVDVPLGFRRLVQIEAVDGQDAPLDREHVLGVAMPDVSIEANRPQQSPLMVLLPPGEYLAYLTGSNHTELFMVPDRKEDDDEDITRVRLRESPQG